MPFNSPSTHSQENFDTQDYLSDENVAILYEIIQYAEADPNVELHPFRALFAAYDAVLPQYQLDPAHDKIYLRFLFKLGDKRGKDETLFESFQRLLEDLGIALEFDSDGEAPELSPRSQIRGGYDVGDLTASTRPRRNSFTSMLELDPDVSRAWARGLPADKSLSQFPSPEDQLPPARPFTRATTRPAEENQHRPFASGPIPTAFADDRVTAKEFERNSFFSSQKFARGSRGRSQKRISLNDRRVEHDLAAAKSIQPQLKSDHVPRRQPDAYEEQPPDERLYQRSIEGPSAYDRQRDLSRAHAFDRQRIFNIAQTCFLKWDQLALQATTQRRRLDRVALARDSDMLQRQAWEIWRSKLRVHNESARRDQFFAELERKATDSWRLHVLEKAFSHWSQATVDEAEQRIAARRHVLSLKYFHAWHDLTLEHKHGVEYLLRRRLFYRWKASFERTHDQQSQAKAFYQQCLARFGYWKWFWAFCEQQAPEWYTKRLCKRTLMHWSQRTRKSYHLSNVAVSKQQRTAEASILVKWKRLTDERVRDIDRAEAFTDRKQTGEYFQLWRRSLIYAPAVQKIAITKDWRIAGETFAVFVDRYRTRKRAGEVDRLRRLRSYWTIWNDNLRQRTLAHRIDDRCVLEALYRWIVSERFVLLEQLNKQRLQTRSLRIWSQKLDAIQTQRLKMAQSFERRMKVIQTQSVLAKMRNRLAERSAAELIAFEFYAPKLSGETMLKLMAGLHRIREMEQCASDTEFFFLGKRLLKYWHALSVESRRRKRHEAYNHVRRRLKTRLSANAFRHWRSRAREQDQLEQLGLAVHSDATLIFRNNLFQLWSSLTTLHRTQTIEASLFYENIVLKRYVVSWTAQNRHIWELKETAVVNETMRVQKTAFVFLRQIRLKFIEVQGQQGKAANLHANHRKRHAQIFLQRWRDQTTGSRAAELRGGTSLALEESSVIDQSVLPPVAPSEIQLTVRKDLPMPRTLPGYLSTPSKRAERAKALVQSTTPAGTPFLNRLRAQLENTPRSSAKQSSRRTARLGDSIS